MKRNVNQDIKKVYNALFVALSAYDQLLDDSVKKWKLKWLHFTFENTTIHSVSTMLFILTFEKGLKTATKTCFLKKSKEGVWKI